MRRFRVLLRESQSRHHQFLKLLLGHPVSVPIQARTSGRRCAERLSQIEDWRARLGEAGESDTTRIIQDAALYVFSRANIRSVDGRLMNRNGLVADTMLVWRTTSGSAHGLPWSVFHHYGTEVVGEPDEFGIGMITSAGDVRQIVWPLNAVTLIMAIGFDLLDKRGGGTRVDHADRERD